MDRDKLERELELVLALQLVADLRLHMVLDAKGTLIAAEQHKIEQTRMRLRNAQELAATATAAAVEDALQERKTRGVAEARVRMQIELREAAERKMHEMSAELVRAGARFELRVGAMRREAQDAKSRLVEANEVRKQQITVILTDTAHRTSMHRYLSLRPRLSYAGGARGTREADRGTA